jgi:hypothetical protein
MKLKLLKVTLPISGLIFLAFPGTALAVGSASLYLSPGCGPVYNGNNLTVDIHEDSGSTAVNGVQSNLDYPTSQFSVVSVTGGAAVGSPFTTIAQNDTSTPGLIQFGAGTAGGSNTSGDQIVARVVLQAITSTNSATVSFTDNGLDLAVTADDGLGTNILTGTTGGMYPQSIAHVCGSLVRINNSNMVYQISGGKKHPFGSSSIFTSYGYSWSWIASNITTAEQTMPTGSAMPFREGTLLQGTGNGIYVVENSNGSVLKRLISSHNIFSALGYSSSDVMRVSNTELPPSGSNINSATLHPAGTLVRRSGSSGVYLVGHGSKMSFPNSYTLTTNGYSFSKVKIATSADLALPTVGGMTLRPGALVRGATSSVYVIDVRSGAAQKRRISNPTAMSQLYYSFSQVMQLPTSVLPAANGQAL